MQPTSDEHSPITRLAGVSKVAACRLTVTITRQLRRLVIRGRLKHRPEVRHELRQVLLPEHSARQFSASRLNLRRVDEWVRGRWQLIRSPVRVIPLEQLLEEPCALRGATERRAALVVGERGPDGFLP